MVLLNFFHFFNSINIFTYLHIDVLKVIVKGNSLVFLWLGLGPLRLFAGVYGTGKHASSTSGRMRWNVHDGRTNDNPVETCTNGAGNAQESKGAKYE